jgi:hypothetical protein
MSFCNYFYTQNQLLNSFSYILYLVDSAQKTEKCRGLYVKYPETQDFLRRIVGSFTKITGALMQNLIREGVSMIFGRPIKF